MSPLMLPCYVHSDGRVEFPGAEQIKFRLGQPSGLSSDDHPRINPSSLVPITDPEKYIRTKEIELRSLIGFIRSKSQGI
ncbi:hypothetical protein HOA55_00165 [archaeon]|nr:hypothetical protein [archaeon]MBT6819754.1 hypothetical protein [archaeon]MBT7567469.1 hypothetical protein [archaeon]